ncbi:MAG: ATP-binding protein [Desulfobulbaceae bacterium]|nr:ATP-binding protein [Desulfobulbaceae bacterium]
MSLSSLCQTGESPQQQYLQHQLKWLLFLRVIVLTLLLGVSVLLQTQGHELAIPPLRYITAFIAVVYIFTICSAFLLNSVRFKCHNIFTYIQILVDVLLSSCLVIYTGGSQSLFTIIYFFPIISAAILLRRRGSLANASLCSFAYGGIILAEYLGYQPSLFQQAWRTPLVFPTVAMHYFAVSGMSFFLVATLGTLLSERMKKTEAALSTASLNYDRLALLYKQIVDDISSGIITVGPNGIITSFNRAAEEITGFTANEIIGRAINQQFPEFNTSETNTVRPISTLTCRDGKSIPVGFSQSRLNMPDNTDRFRLFTFQDLSQIKMLEEQMRQAEKMAAVGKMAAGVAHEFRNPLAAISGAAQVLAQDIKGDPTNQGLMNIIVRECDRLEKSISDFLLFSKPAAPEPKWFSLNSLINETLQLIKQAPNWHDHCQIEIDVPTPLDYWADPGQLQQVLFNLINNSCLAMDTNGGKIKIAAQTREENNESHTVLTISDNGPGIPPDLTEKIFEPFFTTREKGTGLGLAIVKQIIESHDGEIQLETTIDNGTTFTIILPLP